VTVRFSGLGSSEYLVNGSRPLTDLLSWLAVLGMVVGFLAVASSTLLAGMWCEYREGRERKAKRAARSEKKTSTSEHDA
jgi:hypothetical protein